jgi:NADH pyrophosphatase NudC (nudix superfamily)
MSATLPQNVIRFCPKCGSVEFHYRSDNSFGCAQCKFQLYVNSAAAVAALIVDEKGRLLLTRRALEPNKGMLDLPGGFVDVMETAEEALEREIKEELDLKLDHYTYFTSFPNEYVFGGLSVFTLDLAYICQINSFQNIKAMDDISDFEFFHPTEIRLDEICSGSIQSIIQRYMRFCDN